MDERTGHALGGRAAATDGDEDGSTMRIPVLAERLVVGAEPVTRGTLRLHKGVETEEQALEVPVLREEVQVDRISPEAYEAASGDPAVTLIPIYEEQLVVEKRLVLKEYVRISKRAVEEQRTVRGTVRREYVEVSERPADQ